MKDDPSSHDFSDQSPSVEQILVWMQDPCFYTLTTLSLAYQLKDAPYGKQLREDVQHHSDDCRSCLPNVRGRAETASDQAERFACRQLADKFGAGWIRQGGEIENHRTADGRYSRIRLADDLKTPYRRIEVFEPHDSRQKGYLRYVVDSVELFEDEAQLLQHFDVVAANQLQTYGPEAGELHWSPIFSERDYRVLICHDGKEKEIASGWTLHSRYGDLVRRNIDLEERRSTRVGPSIRRALLSQEIETIEEHAKAYKEKESNFAGYLDELLRQRRVDRYRRSRRDPLLGDNSHFDSDAPREAGETGRTLAGLRRLLEPHLDERDLRIFDLKVSGFSDAYIGHELKVTRETANRRFSRIKDLARDLQF